MAATKRWLYLTSYCGYFPDLADHRYDWNDEHTCFFNVVSPARVRSILTDAGHHHYVGPSESLVTSELRDRVPTKRELVVMARVE